MARAQIQLVLGGQPMHGFGGFDCGRGYPGTRVGRVHWCQRAEGIDVDQSGATAGH